MNCISDEVIQKFIDGEATRSEIAIVEDHQRNCDSCGERIDHQKVVSARLREAVNRLGTEEVVTPRFEQPQTPKGQGISIRMRLMYAFAAASVLIFIFILTKNSIYNEEEKLPSNIDWEYNANLPLSDQGLVIQVTNAEGGIVEYILD